MGIGGKRPFYSVMKTIEILGFEDIVIQDNDFSILQDIRKLINPVIAFSLKARKRNTFHILWFHNFLLSLY